MNLLFLGDVFGDVGCNFVSKKITQLKRTYDIDITIVNGENSAKGNGITPYSAEFLFNNGADIITTGNHCFSRKEIIPFFECNDCLIRPANYPDGAPGKGVCIYDMGRTQIAVINLMGTLYMDSLDNPFNVIDNVLNKIDTPNIFVDFHAEATSEKKAMGHYLKGRVTGVFGTHTHVQTADAVILDNHTAYITDVGMCGPEMSVLGIQSEQAVNRFRTKIPQKATESEENCFINAVVVSFNQADGKSNSITPVILR